MASYLNIPSWYKGTGLVGQEDPSSFYRVANVLLPHLAASDQTSVATFLASDKDNPLKDFFKDYVGTSATPRETPRAGTESRGFFLSADRAREALSRLEQHRAIDGTKVQMGPGYKFLTQAIQLLAHFGSNPNEGITRAEYEQLQSGLESLISQGRSDSSLAPYAELATKFINPTLIGELYPKADVGGRTIYGQASGKLFT